LIILLSASGNDSNPSIKTKSKQKRRILVPADLISTDINSANYKNLLMTSNDTWLIFIYESIQADSWILYETWVNFTVSCKEINKSMKFGIIDITFERIVPSKLQVSTYPSLLFVKECFFYHLNIEVDQNSLNCIINEKSFMQFDRFPLRTSPPFNPFLYLREVFLASPLSWFSSIFSCSIILIIFLK
jgi:hypothetical protein